MMDASKIILCRCENVTLADIQELLNEGMDSMQEIKKMCQGRTCKELVAREIANHLKKKVDEVDIPVSRIPIKPITLGMINDFNGGV